MTPSAAMTEQPRSSEALRRATGRDRADWFDALDAWGAVGRPFREISGWLTGQGVGRWWAQKLIVEYEQARGVRAAGVRRDGTFTVTASKSVGASAARIYEAFTDPALRRRWLPGARMRLRTSRDGRTARFDWQGGPTRVNVAVDSAGRGKGRVAVEQELLPSSRAAEQAKAFWRERLSALKALLEG